MNFNSFVRKREGVNIALLILIVAIGMVGVTVAYFSVTSSFSNVFTTPEFNTTIYEEFTSPDNWMPGTTTPKAVYATNNSNVDVIVRAKYSEEWIAADGNELSLEQDGNRAAIINLVNDEDWVKSDEYFYYTKDLKPGETTSSFMESVTFNPEITSTYNCFVNEEGHNECTSTGTGYDGATYKLTIIIEMAQIGTWEDPVADTNQHILAAYTYNQTTTDSNYCVTGEETSCEITTCYESKEANACPIGTILKYEVKDDTSYCFMVVHDDGETMTLQQREHTLEPSEWYINNGSYGIAEGPTTVLPVLEAATSDWAYVNDQTYTMGTTNFNNTNAFTACSAYNLCDTNGYVMAERTAKARMITQQEAYAAGCGTSNGTCPIWMFNYTTDCQYGGCPNPQTGNNYGVWTMSVNETSVTPWIIFRNGYSSTHMASTSQVGTRAVIVINK